jgi:hypothetical protein
MYAGVIALSAIALAAWLVIRQAYPPPPVMPAEEEEPEPAIAEPATPADEQPQPVLEPASPMPEGARAAPAAEETVGALEAETKTAPVLELPVGGSAEAALEGPPASAAPAASDNGFAGRIVVTEDMHLDDVLAVAAEEAKAPRHATIRLAAVITALGIVFAAVMWFVVRGFVNLFDQIARP